MGGVHPLEPFKKVSQKQNHEREEGSP